MRKLSLAAVLAALVLAAAGCGDDDDDTGDGGGGGGGNGATTTTEESGSGGGGGSGGGSTLALAADPGGALKFDKTELTAKAGEVTIDFDNPASVPHAVEVEGNGVEEETDTITQSKASLTVDLEAGEYKFYCPVGNHEQAGMVGTLTVN